MKGVHTSPTAGVTSEVSRAGVGEGQWYTIERGDTLYGLARRFKVPAKALVAINELDDPNRIYAGSRLWIPRPATATSTVTVNQKAAAADPQAHVDQASDPNQAKAEAVTNTNLALGLIQKGLARPASVGPGLAGNLGHSHDPKSKLAPTQEADVDVSVPSLAAKTTLDPATTDVANESGEVDESNPVDETDASSSTDDKPLTNGEGVAARWTGRALAVGRWLVKENDEIRIYHKDQPELVHKVAKGADGQLLSEKQLGTSVDLVTRIILPEDSQISNDSDRKKTTLELQKDKAWVFWAETTGNAALTANFDSYFGPEDERGKRTLGAQAELTYSLLVPHRLPPKKNKLSMSQMVATQTIDLPLTAKRALKLLPGSQFTLKPNANASAALSQGDNKVSLKGSRNSTLTIDRLEGSRAKAAFTYDVEVEFDAAGKRVTEANEDGKGASHLSGKAAYKRTITVRKTFMLDLAKPDARRAYERLVGGSPGRAEELCDTAGSGVTRLGEESSTRNTEVEFGVNGERAGYAPSLSMTHTAKVETSISTESDGKVRVVMTPEGTWGFEAGTTFAQADVENAPTYRLNVTAKHEMGLGAGGESVVLELAKPGVREALKALRAGNDALLRELISRGAEGVLYTPGEKKIDTNYGVDVGDTLHSLTLTLTTSEGETASIDVDDEAKTATVQIEHTDEQFVAAKLVGAVTPEVKLNTGKQNRKAVQKRTDVFKLDLTKPLALAAYQALRRGDLVLLNAAINSAPIEGIDYKWLAIRDQRTTNSDLDITNTVPGREDNLTFGRTRDCDIQAESLTDGKFKVTVTRYTSDKATVGTAKDLLSHDGVKKPHGSVSGLSLKVTDAASRGSKTITTYVFDPTRPEATNALMLAAGGNLALADAMAKDPNSGVTGRVTDDANWWGNKLTGGLDLTLSWGGSLGLSAYNERIPQNENRAVLATEVNAKAKEAGKTVVWYALGGSAQVGYSASVEAGPVSTGVGTSASFDYKLVIPSTTQKGVVSPLKLLPTNWQLAEALPTGTEAALSLTRTATANVSAGQNAEVSAGPFKFGAKAGHTARVERIRNSDIAFYRLGDRRSRLVLSTDLAWTVTSALTAEINATLDDTKVKAPDPSANKALSWLDRRRKTVLMRIAQILQAELELKLSGIETSSDNRVAVDFDFADEQARVDFDQMLVFCLRDPKEFNKSSLPASQMLKQLQAASAKASEELTATAETPKPTGGQVVGRYRKKATSSAAPGVRLSLGGFELVNNQAARESSVASLETPEGRQDRIIESFNRSKGGLLKSGSIRWETVASRDTATQAEKLYLHLHLSDLHDKWTSKGEVEGFQAFVAAMGRTPKKNFVKKTKLDFWDRLNPAIHGDTTTNAQFSFSYDFFKIAGAASYDAVVDLYAEKAALISHEPAKRLYASSDPKLRAEAQATLRRYTRSTDEEEKRQLENDYRFIGGRGYLREEAEEFDQAEQVAKLIGSLKEAAAVKVAYVNALDPSTALPAQTAVAQQFLTGFAELGRHAGFEFYTVMATLKALAPGDEVKLHQLSMKGAKEQVMIEVPVSDGVTLPSELDKPAFQPSAIDAAVPKVSIPVPKFNIAPQRWALPGALSVAGRTPDALVAQPGDSAYARATRAMATSHFDEALVALRGAGSSSNEVQVLNLLAQCHIARGEYDEAIKVLEGLGHENRGDATTALWLGYAYTRAAELLGTSLAEPAVAIKMRAALDNLLRARNQAMDRVEPAQALFELYLRLPANLGGGIERAHEVANTLRARQPLAGRILLARYYEQRGNMVSDADQKNGLYAQAEGELKAAAALQEDDIGAELELASFFSRRGRSQDADETLARVRDKASQVPRVWLAEAQMLFDAGRDLSKAESLIKRYQSASVGSDDPPQVAADALLAKVQSKLGTAGSGD